MFHQPSKKRRGFTLVELMIVVAVIALLAIIAVPGFLRARKRSLATTVLDNLRLIDGAKDLYATEYNKTAGTPIPQNLAIYLKRNIQLYNTFAAGASNDPKINTIVYTLNDFNTLPVANGADSAFSDVVDTAFWSPYSAN